VLLKKTKIVCTLGPASSSRRIIEKMYRAGMDGVRINTAYGTFSEYALWVKRVREVADIPVMVDVKGPEIRIKVTRRRVLSRGDILEVNFKKGEVCFNHDFYDEVEVNDHVYIDNGKIRTRVIEKEDRKLRLLALDAGIIENGKGVNVPNRRLSVPTLLGKDLEAVQFAKENDVEYIALSFTRNVADVEKLAQTSFGGAIIAKIENIEGVQNAEAILEHAAGLMVARGDLGVELKPEKVPLVQKTLIRLCNQKGKLAVTATEMLESMIQKPTPTRAEVSDVANAILDGSDAIMLSGETAVGHYPVEAVKVMARVARETEKAIISKVEDAAFINISDTVSRAVQRICQNMPVQKVISLTRSGYTARMIARFRLSQPTIAVTPDAKVKRQLQLVYGIHPVQIDYREEKDRIRAVANRLYEIQLVKDEETVLFTSATRTRQEHASNSIEIHEIKELRNYSFP
jgi:pyruvate kinase